VTDAARRLLVPVNGLAHALAAGDVAAALARGDAAEVVLLHVVPPATTDEADEAAAGLVRDLAARLALLGIRVDHRVRVGDHPGRAILCELECERYEAVVVGGRHRGGTQLTLGTTIPTVLTQRHTPALVLIVSR
jgi:nucleotide-binding universal stress UspA family protein